MVRNSVATTYGQKGVGTSWSLKKELPILWLFVQFTLLPEQGWQFVMGTALKQILVVFVSLFALEYSSEIATGLLGTFEELVKASSDPRASSSIAAVCGTDAGQMVSPSCLINFGMDMSFRFLQSTGDVPVLSQEQRETLSVWQPVDGMAAVLGGFGRMIVQIVMLVLAAVVVFLCMLKIGIDLILLLVTAFLSIPVATALFALGSSPMTSHLTSAGWRLLLSNGLKYFVTLLLAGIGLTVVDQAFQAWVLVGSGDGYDPTASVQATLSLVAVIMIYAALVMRIPSTVESMISGSGGSSASLGSAVHALKHTAAGLARTAGVAAVGAGAVMGAGSALGAGVGATFNSLRGGASGGSGGAGPRHLGGAAPESDTKAPPGAASVAASDSSGGAAGAGGSVGGAGGVESGAAPVPAGAKARMQAAASKGWAAASKGWAAAKHDYASNTVAQDLMHGGVTLASGADMSRAKSEGLKANHEAEKLQNQGGRRGLAQELALSTGRDLTKDQLEVVNSTDIAISDMQAQLQAKHMKDKRSNDEI